MIMHSPATSAFILEALGTYNQVRQKLVCESEEPSLNKPNASFALKLFENNEQMIISNKTHCTQ